MLCAYTTPHDQRNYYVIQTHTNNAKKKFQSDNYFVLDL